MNLFSISQLEQFSGIKAHTIRMWEKRYNALTPTRSVGNTRYYNNVQFRRLLNIVSLMHKEYKVSELCSMPDDKLFEIIEKDLTSKSPHDGRIDYYISQLLAAGMSFDELYFEKIFANCLLRYDLKNVYVNIIYPMLARIGLMWSNDSIPPAQEHFISNLIRQKISAAIDLLPPPKSSENSWLLFLPENEFHEIGLLFSHYILKSAGKKVFYLGSNLPIETISNTIKEIRPSNLLLFLVHHDNAVNIEQYLNSLVKNFKTTQVFLSGNEKLIQQLKTGKSVSYLRTVEELENEANK